MRRASAGQTMNSRVIRRSELRSVDKGEKSLTLLLRKYSFQTKEDIVIAQYPSQIVEY